MITTWGPVAAALGHESALALAKVAATPARAAAAAQRPGPCGHHLQMADPQICCFTACGT